MSYRLQADDFDNKSLQIQVYSRKCELQFFSNVDRADASKLCEFPIRFPSVELLPADDQVSVKSHVFLLLLLVLEFWLYLRLRSWSERECWSLSANVIDLASSLDNIENVISYKQTE